MSGKGEAGVLVAMQAALGKAMEEMGQVSKLLEVLQADINQIKGNNAELRADVDDATKRLGEAESWISELEDDNASLRITVQHNAKVCRELKAAVEDAANRDRRQNLRLIGLKEKLEGRNPAECVRKIIYKALNIEMDKVQLQRVRRATAEMPSDDKPPRPIIIRFPSYLERERVLAASREKYRKGEKVWWGGCRLSFFPHMTRELAERRKRFTEARKKLHALDVRFTLAYPAEWSFTWGGKRMKFDDHSKAMEFLKKINTTDTTSITELETNTDTTNMPELET